MSEEQLNEERMPRAMAGDHVEMNIEMIHEMNLEAIYVFFQHTTNERIHITLVDDNPERLQPVRRSHKRTMWAPSGDIGPEHIPGMYTLTHISLYTAANRRIRLEAEEHFAHKPKAHIRVVEEPESTPELGTFEFA